MSTLKALVPSTSRCALNAAPSLSRSPPENLRTNHHIAEWVFLKQGIDHQDRRNFGRRGCKPGLASGNSVFGWSLRASAAENATGGEEETKEQQDTKGETSAEVTGREKRGASSLDVTKELSKAVNKTATTFAPRASTKTSNPAVPGSLLFSVFEIQAYAAMVFGGLLSFNVLFPSDNPDIWRLMGMWSVWMFTIPSLRARDCSQNEKTALNYLFLAVPLINISLPLLWRSFAAVWTADVIAFIAIYAWKMEWLQLGGKDKGST